MTEKEILAHVDHTLLGVAATWDEIREVVDDGIRFETVSVCIPPRFVKKTTGCKTGGRDLQKNSQTSKIVLEK